MSTKKLANAKCLNKQYVAPLPRRQSSLTRRVLHEIQKLRLNHSFAPFTGAITVLKSSSALGPGGLTNLHLKHLGQKGFLLLHQLKSAVLRRCVVESAGVAFIIPWPLEQLQQQLYDHQSFPLLRLGNSFKRQQTISQQIR